MRLTLIKILLICVLMVLDAGCDLPRTPLNQSQDPGFGFPVALVALTEVHVAGESSQLLAYWNRGHTPVTIAWDFGGGAENLKAQQVPWTTNTIELNGQAVEVTGWSTTEVTWLDLPQVNSYTVTVTVTDNRGIPATASTTVTVFPQTHPPLIENVSVADQTLTVTVSDADDDPVTVTVSGYAGMTPDSSSKTAAAVGSVSFRFVAEDVMQGATSDVTITAEDNQGGVDTASAEVTVPAPELQPDTLHAIVLQDQVATGDPVTVIVATGATAHPFQYMTGVGVTFPIDGTLVHGSFNAGVPGGLWDTADGVWSGITQDDGFLVPPNFPLINPGPDPDGTLQPGLLRIDFNLTPLGNDIESAFGALFNFQVIFSAAGEKELSFQEFNGVNRTYYCDFASGEDRFWSAFEGATVMVN